MSYNLINNNNIERKKNRKKNTYVVFIVQVGVIWYVCCVVLFSLSISLFVIMIYNNLIKVESTRVKLYPVRNNDPLSTYIHANYINGYNNIEETTATRAFIATQGPMSNTLNDFWHLVWQESITYLVMITKLKENSKSQCDSYIPDENNIFFNYGEISVCVESIHYEQDYDIRKIILNVSFVTLLFSFFLS
jgi:protein tyrosine phosphatase